VIEFRGQVLADAMIRELRPRAERFYAFAGRPATLAIVTADDRPGTRYLELKQQRFQNTGLAVRACAFGPAATSTDVLLQVHALNADREVDGIFLQFPLPAAVDAPRAADLIDPDKDVDAVASTSLGRVLAGTALHLPATAAAVLRLLEDQLGDLAGRSLVLVGPTGVTDRSIGVLTLARGATSAVLRPADPALADAAAGADAIVITDELPAGETLRNVRNGALLIDAAYAGPPRPAGWLPPRALEHLGTYLPQYRNVGPLTVALLMESTLRAAFLMRD